MSVKSSRLSNTNYGQICLYKMGRSWIRILKFLSLIRIQNTGLNKNILTRFLKSNVIFFSLFYVQPEPPKSLHPEPIKRKGRLRHTAGTFRYSGSTTLVYVKIAKSYKQPQKGLFCSGWELSVLITLVKYAFFMFHRVFSALRMVEPFQGQRCNMNVHNMAIFQSTLGFSNLWAMDPHYFLGIRIQQCFSPCWVSAVIVIEFVIVFNFNKITIANNFLAFFQFFFFNFSLLDPYSECGSGSRRKNECGSGSTALLKQVPVLDAVVEQKNWVLPFSVRGSIQPRKVGWE